jgi:hypothetical protein
VSFVVLNDGRSPCCGVVDGVDNVFEDGFVRVSCTVVHPASKATEATAATAKVVALFTELPVDRHVGRCVRHDDDGYGDFDERPCGGRQLST